MWTVSYPVRVPAHSGMRILWSWGRPAGEQRLRGIWVKFGRMMNCAPREGGRLGGCFIQSDGPMRRPNPWYRIRSRDTGPRPRGCVPFHAGRRNGLVRSEIAPGLGPGDAGRWVSSVREAQRLRTRRPSAGVTASFGLRVMCSPMISPALTSRTWTGHSWSSHRSLTQIVTCDQRATSS